MSSLLIKHNTFLLFIYCKKGEGGDKKEACTNTLIIKDEILWLNSKLIPKVKRLLKSKTYN